MARFKSRFLIVLLAVTRVAMADGVGHVTVPVSVPSETLPPNEALRKLQKQEMEQRDRLALDFIRSQRGKAYFAYAPVPAVDPEGHPVIDRTSQQQIMDGFCIVWRPNWVADNRDLEIVNPKWYTGMSFRVDPRTRSVTVYNLSVPNGTVTSAGFQPRAGTVEMATRIVVPLEDQPKAEWNCSPQTWVDVLKSDERHFAPVIPWGASRGDPYSYKKYRERERQNCIVNPQIYHGRC